MSLSFIVDQAEPTALRRNILFEDLKQPHLQGITYPRAFATITASRSGIHHHMHQAVPRQRIDLPLLSTATPLDHFWQLCELEGLKQSSPFLSLSALLFGLLAASLTIRFTC